MFSGRVYDKNRAIVQTLEEQRDLLGKGSRAELAIIVTCCL